VSVFVFVVAFHVAIPIIVLYSFVSCFSYSILYGGAKAHTASLARAFVNVFRAVKQLHVEYKAATTAHKINAAIKCITVVSGVTAAELVHRRLLRDVCLEMPTLMPNLIRAFHEACFPRSNATFLVPWTGTVSRVAGTGAPSLLAGTSAEHLKMLLYCHASVGSRVLQCSCNALPACFMHAGQYFTQCTSSTTPRAPTSVVFRAVNQLDCACQEFHFGMLCLHIFAVLKFVADECMLMAGGDEEDARPQLVRLRNDFVRCLHGTRWFLTRGWVPLTGRDGSGSCAEAERF
jgi:hypothetical protein